MSSVDQRLVDYLFEQIFVQKLRCINYNLDSQTTTNKSKKITRLENKILDKMVEKYKEYYKNKALKIKEKLGELKEANLNSYLVFDTNYYINQHDERIKQIDEYLADLETKTLKDISKEKLSHISDDIDTLYPNFVSDPTLLGELCC